MEMRFQCGTVRGPEWAVKSVGKGGGHMSCSRREFIRTAAGAAELAATQVFCMTPGTATNDFSTLPFKNLVGDYY